MHGSLARLALLLLLPLALVACRATPSHQALPRPDLEVELETPELCRVHVVREEQSYGSLLPMRVYEDQTLVGTLAPGAFLCWERPSGRILLTVVLERRPIDGGDIESYFDLVCEVGEVAYASIAPVRSSGGKPRVTRLDADEGRALIAKSRPAPTE